MKRTNRLLSLLLAFVMVLALIPNTLTPVYAAYEDGDECWNCGHYHWGDYMHECGACSPDCTNDWCALETHCHRCGGCLNGDYPCDECGLCVEYCEFNSMMAGCESGDICVDSSDWIDCLCEGCGEFFENQNGLCGTCLDAGVVRCPDCYELASECSDKMCEYDDEYEDHFCIDCGSCFHDVTLCESCAGAGELRCEDCCENLTNSLGYDGSCGDVWCSNDTYFEQHLDEEYEDHPDFDDHDSFPSNRWSHDKNSHWRECRLCDEDENEELWESHRTDLAAHSYDSRGVCTVCGYSAGNKLYISRQPKDARCTTSIAVEYEEDPANGLLWSEHNSVTFSVAVKGGTGSYTYQWYRQYKDRTPDKLEDGMFIGSVSGTHTATLTVLVSPKACSVGNEYQHYCVISDGKTTVTTEKAIIKASHAYSNKYAINTVSTTPEKATYKAKSLTYINKKGEAVTVTAPASESHRHQCLCDDAGLTRHYKTKRPVMHTFGDATLLGKSAKTGATDYDRVYEKTCTACGYKTYVETHRHVFLDSEDHENEDGFLAYGCLLVKRDISGHTIRCLVEGCSQTKKEDHVWRWQWVSPTADESGRFFRVCDVCDFNTRRDLAADEADPIIPIDDDGNPVEWDMSRALVIAENAKTSLLYAKPNDQLTLIISDNDETLGKRCTGWAVTYRAPGSASAADLTSAYKFTETTDGKWKTTVTFGSYSGGTLTFTPKMTTCTAHSYITTGRVEPVCIYDGFSGYSICKYCHTPDPTDTRSDEERVIPATGTEHTGNRLKLYEYEKEVLSPTGKKTITWTTDKNKSNDKRYNYKAGSCTEKGYEGDFLCSACERVIPGKWEYKHPTNAIELRGAREANCFRDGYTGDYFCTRCENRDGHYEKGKVISSAEYHRENHGKSTYFGGTEIAPTCTTAGKKADELCYHSSYPAIGDIADVAANQ